MKPRWSRRGTALLLILFMLSLVMMFLGALITTNQSALRLSTGLQAEKSATANCQSGLAYAWQLLERDRTFGTRLFTHNSPPPTMVDTRRIEIRLKNPSNNITSQFVEGRYVENPNSGFRVRILNRIASPFATPPADNYLNSSQAIPPFGAILRIEGFEGRRTRVLEVALQQSPFVSTATHSGGDTTCHFTSDVSKWTVASNDPFRNSLRARGTFKMDGLTEGALRFEPSRGNSSVYGRYGVLLPSNGVRDLANQELTEEQYQRANEQSRGNLFKRSAQVDRIKELNTRDLKLPSRTVGLTGGVYRFEKTNYDVQFDWDQQESRTEVDPSTGETRTVTVNVPKSATGTAYARGFGRYANDTATQPQELWLASTYIPPAPSGPGISNGRVTIRGPVEPHIVNVDSSGAFDLPGQGGLAARVNLKDGTFDVPPDTLLDVQGDFQLRHNGLAREDARPKLRLVNSANPDDENQPLFAGLKASGSVIIDGSLRGSGTVVAEGNMQMYAESALSASAARPVALFANGDVSLLKDDRPTDNRTSEATLSEDWTLYKRSVGNLTETANFLNDDFTTQQTKVNSVMLNSVVKSEDGSGPDADPSYYFSHVTTSYFPSPDTNGLLAKAQTAYDDMRAGGLTLGEAIRFREYCRNLSTDLTATREEFDPETGVSTTVPAPPTADRWLDAASVRAEVTQLVQDQLVSYGYLVGQEGGTEPRYKDMQAWFNAVSTNPYENDGRTNSLFRGLVYSRNGNFKLEANYNALTVIGALVVPRGNISFDNASGIRTVYDPRYLRDLLLPDPRASLKLDQVYWRLF